jgi:hypothetical protein
VSYNCSERSCPKRRKIDNVKENYEELERVFDKFPTYHMNTLFGDFSGQVGREDIFKPTTEIAIQKRGIPVSTSFPRLDNTLTKE